MKLEKELLKKAGSDFISTRKLNCILSLQDLKKIRYILLKDLIKLGHMVTHLPVIKVERLGNRKNKFSKLQSSNFYQLEWYKISQC